MGKTANTPPLVSHGVGVYHLRQLLGRADQVDLEIGFNYFERFHNRICEAGRKWYGTPDKVSCGLYSALSPNNSEESNFEDMIRAIAAFHEASEGEQHAWEKLRVHTYGPNKAKALRILQGEDPTLVLRGIKTYNFYHNILRPSDPHFVCVDGHMVNIYNNKRVKLQDAGISSTEYAQIASGIREVARDSKLIPCQLQAILWITWRRIHRIFYNPQYKLPLE